MLSNTVGVIHFVASICALLSGTFVLWALKGTKTHKQVGYLYVVSMFLVLLMPNLWTISGANYLTLHFSFMYWSVIGLYCAFSAEIFTRIPLIYELDANVVGIFYAMVGIASALVGGIGSIYFKKYKNRWIEYVDSFDK